MVMIRLPWLGLKSPNPPEPASEVDNASMLTTTTCGICGSKIAEGEASVQVRHGPTSKDPTPPLLPAHAVCFRRELLPPW
jgi:hypothetical protein